MRSECEAMLRRIDRNAGFFLGVALDPRRPKSERMSAARVVRRIVSEGAEMMGVE